MRITRLFARFLSMAYPHPFLVPTPYFDSVRSSVHFCRTLVLLALFLSLSLPHFLRQAMGLSTSFSLSIKIYRNYRKFHPNGAFLISKAFIHIIIIWHQDSKAVCFGCKWHDKSVARQKPTIIMNNREINCTMYVIKKRLAHSFYTNISFVCLTSFLSSIVFCFIFRKFYRHNALYKKIQITLIRQMLSIYPKCLKNSKKKKHFLIVFDMSASPRVYNYNLFASQFSADLG